MNENRIEVLTSVHEGHISENLHGQFIEHLGTCVEGGIYVGENNDVEHLDGLRKAVVDALALLEPPVVRWPGGCYADTYHWRDGIGPKDQRPITYNATFGTNQLDTHQFGTHEFMDFCQLINAKAWMNVNMMTGSVKEMAEWAEYCNRHEDTTLSKERKQNGAPQAFDVLYWGIGNEAWAGGGCYTPESYANSYRQYSTGFPSFPVENSEGNILADRLNSQLIAVGPDGNKPKERINWTIDFFQALEKYRLPKIDGYDLHFYNWNMMKEAGEVTDFDETQWYRLFDGAMEVEEVIVEQYDLIQEYTPQVPVNPWISQAKVELIIGEWGNWHPLDEDKSALWQQNTVRDMISYALTLDIFHKHCDKVAMACLAQTVNVLGALILTEKDKIVLTPTYHLFMMYKNHRNAQKIRCQVNSPVLFEEKAQVYAIHSFASIKGNIMTLNVINTSYNEDLEVDLTVDQAVTYLTGKILTGDQPSDYNDFDMQAKVAPRQALAPIGGGKYWKLSVPKGSVTVYTFALQAKS